MGAAGPAQARRLVLIIAAWQFAFGLIIALPLAALIDLRTGCSALLGATIAALGSASMAFGLRALKPGATPGRLLNGFIVGEALKLAVTVALFAAVILTLNVRPLAILGMYVAAFVVYWIVLIKATSKLVP